MGKRIKVTIAGQDRFLEPTIEALMNLSDTYGGLNPALRQVGDCNVNAVTVVLAEGLGIAPGEDRVSLRRQIFEGGVSNFLSPAQEFIQALVGPQTDPVPKDGLEPKNASATATTLTT